MTDVLLHGQFWVENELIQGSWQNQRRGMWEPRVIESVREGNGGRFQERRKGKENSLCFVVVQFELISGHPWFCRLGACIEFFGEVGHFTERSGFLELCVIWFTEQLAMISERGVIYRTKRMGSSTEPWGTPYMSCDGDEDEFLTEVDWYLSERYDWNHWSAVDWMPKRELIIIFMAPHLVRAQSAYKDIKIHSFHHTHRHTRVQAGEENLVVNSVKSCRNILKKNRNVTVQSGENIVYITKRSRCCVLLDRLTERGCWGGFLGDEREVCGERLFSRILDRNGRFEMGW